MIVALPLPSYIPLQDNYHDADCRKRIAAESAPFFVFRLYVCGAVFIILVLAGVMRRHISPFGLFTRGWA